MGLVNDNEDHAEIFPHTKRHSMIDARSHQLFEVDSDHRLVTVTQHRKNDRERAKTINHEKQNEPDKVLQFLKKTRRNLP